MNLSDSAGSQLATKYVCIRPRALRRVVDAGVALGVKSGALCAGGSCYHGVAWYPALGGWVIC